MNSLPLCGPLALAGGLVLTFGAPVQARNIAILGAPVLGHNDAIDSDAGTPFAHYNVPYRLNDADINSREDTWSNGTDGGQNFGMIGVLFPSPTDEPITSVTVSMATFGDGGWFGENGFGPGAGQPLPADKVIAPVLQATTDFGVTWTTVAETNDYVSSFTGHLVGGGSQPNPSRRNATFTLTSPLTGVTGVRLIGPTGGNSDGNGFLGVFDFAVEATPAAGNIAPQGTANIGFNDAVDADAGTTFVHAGVAASINDNSFTTRVDTFSGGADGGQAIGLVGVNWPTARVDAVKTLKLTLATFGDGGWFGTSNASPGAGVALGAILPVAPDVQTTTDGVTWTTVPSTSNYMEVMEDHVIGGGLNGNPTHRTSVFTITTPEAGVLGVRLIGPNGGVADGNGFLGVAELEVFAVAANDVDSDGMDDDWETDNGLNVGVDDSADDPDMDGLTNAEEFTRTTKPQDDDSDDDGVKDGAEVAAGTNPLNEDTDADGLLDGEEATAMTNPLVADTDGDGLTDGTEVNTLGTDPLDADSDDDLVRDGMEVANGSDPKSAASVPANEAFSGTAIMGVNDAIDSDAGTPQFQAGVLANVNDDNLTTRVDTYNGAGTETVSFVGVTWATPRTRPIEQVEVSLAVFFDGGWFGQNFSGPGTGGLLGPAYLVEPTVQISTDNGVTWTSVGATSDYLAEFDNHPLPTVDFGLPTQAKAIFRLDTPVTDITGIRLIGPEGGTASGGFLGVWEFRAIGSTPDSDGDGMSDGAEITAGTDPGDAESVLRLTEVVKTATEATVSWTSVPGRVYRAEVSTDLVTWERVADVPAADAPATSTTVTLPLPVTELYLRLRVR